MRVEDHLRTPACCPAYRFGIAEAFVADGYPKRQPAHFEELPRIARRPPFIFRRIQLYLCLIPHHSAIGTDDLRDIIYLIADVPVHGQDDGNTVPRSNALCFGKCLLQAPGRAVAGWIAPAGVSGLIRFWKTDDHGAAV